MAIELYDYDPAEALTSDEAIAVFMTEAFDTNDAGYIAQALGVAARAKGFTGVSLEPNLTLETVLAVLKALNVGLTAHVANPDV